MHVMHAAAAGGGRAATSVASRLRFWAMAASVNSSCAPCGPRRRSRSSRSIRFSCANRLSMRLRSRNVPGAFVPMARNRTKRRLGAAPCFEFAAVAIMLSRQIEQCRAMIHERPCRREGLAGRTDIDVLLGVVPEIAARENTILALRLVDDRDVRRDPLFLDRPVQHRRRSVGGIRRQPLRLEAKTLLCALKHGPCSADFGLADGARCLDAAGSDGETNTRHDFARRAKGCVIERREILRHRPAGVLRIALPVPVFARDRALAVGVGLDQARLRRRSHRSDGITVRANLQRSFETKSAR